MHQDTPQPTSGPERERFRSLVELNIAILLFGGTALFAKTIPLPVPYVIFGRSAVAAIALLVFSLIARNPMGVARRGDLRVLLGLGVLLAVHWVTYFHAVRVSTVAVGTIALHTYPIITVLVEPIVDRTRLRPLDGLLALIVLAGIVILVPELSLTSSTGQGVLWGVISAALFTVRNLIVRRYVQRYSGATLMLYQTAVSAAVLLPWVLLTGGGAATAAQWPSFLLLGTVFTALTQSLYASSLRHLSAKTVSIIATLLPMYASVIAIFVLGEVPELRTVIGGVVIIGTVMVETVRAASSRRPK